MKDLLFVSNGHGEDVIAGRVLDEIRASRPEIAIEAWPMVGEGAAYAARGVPTVGARNLLPSAGFATLDPSLMIGDLKAGWIRTHWRQIQYARSIRGRYGILVAVGDIVPIAAGVFSHSPFAFIGCAKSSYYRANHGYTALEKHLLRRHCLVTFPRDRLTVAKLERAGVRCHYAGNPMMDGLEGSGDRLGTDDTDIVIGMMAGTRADAESNLLDLLAGAAATALRSPDAARLRFIFAARDGLDPIDLAEQIAHDARLTEWNVRPKPQSKHGPGTVMEVDGPGGARALVTKGRFADVLRLSRLVVSMAGTASEQAVGLGKPLIQVPSSGVQGERYVKMKMEYFGESALAVPRDPERIADAVLELLGDPARCARMAAAGRERMGEPGASRAIADVILGEFDKLARMRTVERCPA